MNEAQQIKKCQRPIHNEYRWKAGERQVFCKTCQRWQYEADLCRLAVTVQPGRCIRCEKRRPAKDESLCRRCIAELETAELETREMT